MKSIENNTLKKGISILLEELGKRNIPALVKKMLCFMSRREMPLSRFMS